MAISKKLFIVESPAKAKTIGEYLGENFLVEACYGHVRDLPEKRLGVSVRDGFKPEFVLLQNKAKVIAKLKKFSKDSREIYLAADADREGEAICQELKDILQNDKTKFYRIRFREVTKNAILTSLENKEEIDENLVQSQITRRILDRLVGYMISPVLWEKIGGKLSAGRVQSVVLSWICKRESEIQNFSPEKYFALHALVETANGTSLKLELKKVGNEKAVIRSDEELKGVLKDFEINLKGEKVLQNKKIRLQVVELKKRIKTKNPPRPFNSSSLQQDAFRLLKFGVKKTMRIAQELYEGLSLGNKGKSGLITYMRTDSTTVSISAQKKRNDYINTTLGEEFAENRKIFTNSKDSAHEAIRPVDVYTTPNSIQKYLSADQYNLYKFIWERFVASGMTPEKFENFTANFEYKNYSFQFSANKILFETFTKIYPYGKTKEFSEYDSLNLKTGDFVDFLKMQIEEKLTEPPMRYTESTIVRKMEKSGIGRPSTYAAILEVLGKRKYVDSKNKFLYPTSLGVAVDSEMTFYFEEFTNEKFTSEMEKKLDKIESGELKSLDFLNEFYVPFSKNVQKATKHTRYNSSTEIPKEKNLPEVKSCPLCKTGKIRKKVTKKGKLYYACDRFPQCEFVSYESPE